ncbi:MAG: serine hydrolase [Ignavibacteriaceae bacterium]|jgi:CubicO group peptidase (beta-lactamase class C family)
MKNKFLIVIILFLIINGCAEDTPVSPEEPLGYTSVGSPAKSLAEFENVLERIRTDLKIPGLSAAITKNRKIVWAKGFGYANKEGAAEAAPETVYHLASLTKTFAATLIMQLVEENKLSLDDPVSDYGIDLEAQGVIRVKHLLSHTSEGIPGSHYSYSGNRYSYLDYVMSGVSGKSFCELLNEKIILSLNLNLTAANPFSSKNCVQNTAILDKLAQGYTANGQNAVPFPTLFNSAAGLISNVIDVSKFSIALDNDILLKASTKELMFTPFISNNGDTLPHALGWFVDRNESVKVIWHYGYWDAYSALIIKVPEKELSFVILANSNRLSSASKGIGTDQDVNHSVVAQEFLNAFVNGSAQLPDSSVY